MALWQSDLCVSWQAQWMSLLIHGSLALVILLMPWPVNYTLVWMLLLMMVVFSCVRSQRRIHVCQGNVKLFENRRVLWKGREWQIAAKPWITDSGVLFRLVRVGKSRRLHLWIASDSLDREEWRNLRRLLLQQQADNGSGH